jgi:hypothetical protein
MRHDSLDGNGIVGRVLMGIKLSRCVSLLAFDF